MALWALLRTPMAASAALMPREAGRASEARGGQRKRPSTHALLSVRVALTGQCPVMKYHRPLMQAILYDKVQIAKAVNATVISMDDAAMGYKNFDKGESVKYVLDPHGMTGQAVSL